MARIGLNRGEKGLKDRWGIQDLGESSVVIRIAIKVLTGEHWQIARILRAAIKEKFDATNIEIPFPQVKIWQ